MQEEEKPTEGQEATAAGAADPPSDPEALREALEEQTGKAEGYLANWQRAEADLANYKKRAEQERQDVSVFANAILVSGLLPVLDDMERAFDTIDAQLAGLTWVDGMKLIYRKLQSILESQGLSEINTVGQPFDPKVQEAVMEIEGEEGKVVGEVQKGYRFRDRVIRPAMVKVGRGKRPAAEEGSAEASPNA